jgi:uncharacterized protein YndB with AHSA1/START domain
MSDAEGLEVAIHIAARLETVFDFFVDPAKYVEWMGSDATIDAVPGGTYRVRMRDGVETAGVFVEIDAPHRLVFTWGWQGDEIVSPGSSRVEITLTPAGAGTDVLLRHLGLPGDAQRAHHRQGWEMYLSRLSTRALGGDPGPDPNAEESTGRA